jgi:hypothetical protein
MKPRRPRSHLRSCFSVLSFVAAATTISFAQDSGALIEALVRKGILTNQEAEDIRADLGREHAAVIPAPAFAGGKSTDRLSVGMRLQAQFANLNTFVEHQAANPPATNHFFVRRAYLTLKAGLGAEWSTLFTYDFAGSSYDDAVLIYKPTTDLSFDFGLRKVNVAYEERASSGNVKAIERSSVTRYFVESNNGRRLGAASYRIGVHLDGKKDAIGANGLGLVYYAAVTNPERAENFTVASSAGDNTVNQLAYWGNVGLTGKLTNGTWIAGVGAGYLPDQGGAGATNLGKGFDLKIYSLYSEITAGRFNLMAEYLMADVDRGATATRDAKPQGFYLQPSFLVTDTIEAVLRFAALDTDGRGVNLSDGIRSAPGGGAMNKLTEYYAGGNWYLKGNDLKFQFGFVYAKTRETLLGAAAKAEAYGVRSQLQTQF